MLVTVGLAMGWIPGLPTPELEPELVLYLILPPLLYSAAQESSYQAIRDRWRIATLAVALPLVTTAVVGYVAYLTVPGLTLPAALVLGAVVAPPDAVSAQAIGRRLGLPLPVMTLLGGSPATTRCRTGSPMPPPRTGRRGRPSVDSTRWPKRGPTTIRCVHRSP